MGLDDLFKNNVTAGVALGVGAALLAPSLMPAFARAIRPAAKAAIKGGILVYDRGREAMAELAEMAEDTYAEAVSEIAEEHLVTDESGETTSESGRGAKGGSKGGGKRGANA